MRRSCVLALDDNASLGASIADLLGVSSVPAEVRRYPNGEVRGTVPSHLAGCDVAVVQSLHGDAGMSVHDKLCRLLFTVASVRDVGGEPVVVAPYLCYSRQDWRSRRGQALTNRYVALLMEAVGAGAVVTLDVHNVAAFENAFRCPTVHVGSAEMFAGYLHDVLPTDGRLVVASPDAGGVKRADRFRTTLATRRAVADDVAFLQKRRIDSIVSDGEIVGDVERATVVIVDDEIATGETATRAVEACRLAGAADVRLAVTHAAFVGDWSSLLDDVDELIVTDSIPSTTTGRARDKITVLSCAGPLAAALAGRAADTAS